MRWRAARGRIALKGEGGVAGAPAPRHRNLIHTSWLNCPFGSQAWGGRKEHRGHQGLFLKLASEGEKKYHPQEGSGVLQENVYS